MKKIRYITSLVLVCSLLVGKAHAFAWPDLTPMIPFSPQFCAQCIAGNIPMTLSYIDQIPQIKKELESVTDVTKLKQALKSYALSLGNTLFSKLKSQKKKVDFSMTIEECKKQNINVDDEKSIQKGFISLFLEYPSDKPNLRAAYKKKSDQLKMDTALEAYVTSVEMAKKMYGQIDNTNKATEIEGKKAQSGKDFGDLGLITQFNYVEQCLLAGNQTDDSGLQTISDACRKTGLDDCSGTGSSEDQEKEDRMCLWRNAVLATRLYEQFMVYNEYLMALMAQYDAVGSIDNIAFIRSVENSSYGTGKEAEGQKDSSLLPDQIKSQLLNNKAIHISSVSVYADKAVIQNNKMSAEDELFSRYDKSLQSSEKIVVGGFSQVDKVEGMISPTDGKDAEFAIMEELAQVEENLNQAMNMHNMKQNLPAFKKVFQAYDDAERYHDEVVARLERAGKCVQNYLAPYYQNVSQSWFGKACNYYGTGQLYCHYSTERPAQMVESDTLQSEGDFDIVCPDDSAHRCYVKSLSDTRFNSGVVGYLVNLYQAVKDNQATSEVDAYTEVSTEEASEDSYTSKVNIEVVENAGSVSMSNKNDEEDEEAEENELQTPKKMYEKALKQAQKEDKNDTNSSVVARDQNDRRKGDAETPSLASVKSGSAPEGATEGNDKKDHAKAKEEELEMRKNALLNWAIGAEVAKDISNDLLSSSPTFGSASSRFPIWNDQKKFYDQYVDNKYENIEKYLTYTPFAERLALTATAINAVYPYEDIKNELGEVIKTKEEQRTEAQGTIDDFKTKTAAIPVSNAIDDRFKANEADIGAKKLEFRNTINSLKQQIEEKYKQVDELAQALSIANRMYNNQQAKLEEKESAQGQAEDGIKMGDDMYAKSGRKVDKEKSPQFQSFNKTKDNLVNTEAEAKAVLAYMESEGLNPKAIEDQMNHIRDVEIPQLEKDLETKRQNYVLAISDLEEQARLDINQLMEEAENDTTVQDMVAAIVSAGGPTSQPMALADLAMTCVREYAKQTVEDTKGVIEQMKESEELYYSTFADKLLQTHNGMIEKIVGTTVNDIAGCGIVDKLTALELENVEDLLKDAVSVYHDICDDVQCTVPDDRYFVGITYKKDDFRAPKTPLAFTSAPLREVFHFDIEDYGNVDRYVYDTNHQDNNQNIIITKESFRNSGVELPDVWKAILADHAYVERDIDFGKLFGNTNTGSDGIGTEGDPEKMVVRGGIFPCKLDNGTVIDINKTFVYSAGTPADAAYYQMPKCTKVDIVAGKILDKESAYDMHGAENDAAGTIENTSELGQLLAYVPDKFEAQKATLPIPGLPGMPSILPTPQWDKIKHRLTFNREILIAYNRIDTAEKIGEVTSDDFKYNSGNRVFFDKNQFGDYLNFVELETKVADSMVELNEKVVEVKDSLAAVFYETEYEMGDDFSLLNGDDYSSAADVLDVQKGMYLDMVRKSFDGMPQNLTSDFMKEKIAKLKHKVKVLEYDSEEVVRINGDEDYPLKDDGKFAELQKKIEENSANNALGEEYDEGGSDSYKKQIEQLQEPLCVSYVKRSAVANRMSPQPTTVKTDKASVQQKAKEIETDIDVNINKQETN